MHLTHLRKGLEKEQQLAEEELSTQAEQIGREALPTDLVSPCCGLLFQMAWTDYTDMEATRIPEE